MERNSLIQNLKNKKHFDVIVIGGGATGLGIAVDAISRGYSVLLVERSDFAKVTSSKSTKLIHGGLRYLAQGNVKLVYKALKERRLIFKNAPHIAQDMEFIIPCYSLFEKLYYRMGVIAYDILCGYDKKYRSYSLKPEQVVERLPYINDTNLKGGVVYHDGAFDDARMATSLALQINKSEQGLAINYLSFESFIKDNNKNVGVNLIDNETNEQIQAHSNCIINATGVFVDEIRLKDSKDAKQVITPSQGVHLVIENNYDIKESMLIPKTPDGRLLFVVPWYGKLILGTTDTVMDHITENCYAFQEEVDFILETANSYFGSDINKHDIISIYAGQRPLIKDNEHKDTKKLARDDKIMISDSNLISVGGGKWTTYRATAEKAVKAAIDAQILYNNSNPSKTHNEQIHGYTDNEDIIALPRHLRVYGSFYKDLEKTTGFKDKLHENLPYTVAHIHYAIDHEMARTIDDVLSRRLRALFIDAKACIEVSEKVADILVKKLNKDENWKNDQIAKFTELANDYMINNYL